MNKHIVKNKEAAEAFNQLFKSANMDTRCFSLEDCRLRCTCREPHLFKESDCPEHGVKRKYTTADYEIICICREPHLYIEPDCPRHCK